MVIGSRCSNAAKIKMKLYFLLATNGSQAMQIPILIFKISLSVYIPNVWKLLLTSIPFISIKIEGLQSDAWPILSRIDRTPYHGLLTVSRLMADWWRGSQVGPDQDNGHTPPLLPAWQHTVPQERVVYLYFT